MPAFTIRRAADDDTAALAAFAERHFREAFAADNRPEDMDAYAAQAFTLERQRAAIADAQHTILIAEHDGELAGYAQLRASALPPTVAREPAGPAVEIQRFYVDARWHGKGLAGDLMTESLRAAAGRGGHTVWLGVWERNARAIAFYRKHGFHAVGSQPFLLGSDAQTDLVMVRPILAAS